MVEPWARSFPGSRGAKIIHHVNISAVERDTGLSKDTLRAWERRYGFPAPQRDAAGQRIYTDADVAKLRLAKHLLDFGYRPGKILGHTQERLQQLVALATPAPPRGDAAHAGDEYPYPY